MDKNNKLIFQRIPGISMEELNIIKMNTDGYDEEKLTDFLNLYVGKRIKSETIMICTILGFLGVGGIQRFILGQIGMGLLYLVTFGLCYIGTIMDLVNNKKITNERNQHQASLSTLLNFEDIK